MLMHFRIKLTVAGVVAAALLSATGITIASGNSTAGLLPATSNPARTALAAFRTERAATPVEMAARGRLRSEVVTSDDESLPLGQADFALARSYPVRGSDATVWIVPSGEDVCTIIVVPEAAKEAGPWGAGCESIEQVDEGDGYTEMTAPKGPTILVDVIADGATGPAVITDHGTESLAPVNNVSAAVLSRADSIETPNGRVSLTP
jgi:hypothetical protein